MEDFSKRLKEALNKKKMKPTELASRMKLNKGIISNYLSGKYKPRQDRLDLIATILGVDVVWLMGSELFTFLIYIQCILTLFYRTCMLLVVCQFVYSFMLNCPKTVLKLHKKREGIITPLFALFHKL